MATDEHLQKSSKKTCHQTYIGTSPWTEPESRAIRDFILQGSNASFNVSMERLIALIIENLAIYNYDRLYSYYSVY